MNFYKITNTKEQHYEMKYHTGLNVNVEPFKPYGDCREGGIYFSREDILAFLNYGVYLRKVSLPPDEEIYENPGSPKKWKAHRVILGKRKVITPKIIKDLIKEGANPNVYSGYPLRWATAGNKLTLVKFLIPLTESKDARNHALLKAVQKENEKATRLLLPVTDPAFDDSETIRAAAVHGNSTIIKLLIPLTKPEALLSHALRIAVEKRHTEAVKLLLPFSDPKALSSEALFIATKNRHIEMVKLLWPVSDPKSWYDSAMKDQARNLFNS